VNGEVKIPPPPINIRVGEINELHTIVQTALKQQVTKQLVISNVLKL